ncbi:MAG TPA: hypothetical protein VFT87_02990 [Candidatus Saccharimonadales bacterium]|nr:hypothetical protein [Candidatus Saccharimonadales bacterium]
MNHTKHLLWMAGGFVALLAIGAIFKVNVIWLFPLLCMGMMVAMLFGMGHSNTKHDHHGKE